MKSPFRVTIALKLTLLVLTGTVVVFAFAMLYSYTYSKDLILQEAEKNARNLTSSVARRTEQEFRAVAKFSENLACVIECGNPDEPSLLQLILSMVERNGEVFGSTVAFEPYAFKEDVKYFSPYFYKTGTGFAFEQLGTESYRYTEKDWYRIPKLLDKPVWSEPYYDEGGGDITMTTYSYPFYQSGGPGKERRFTGIVTADVSLEWLCRLVDSIKVGQTGYCFIISDTGVFVTYPDPAMVMRESIFSRAEALNDPHLRGIGRRMQRTTSGFVDLGTSLTDEEAYLAYARIPSPKWSLAAVFPKRELFQEVTDLHTATVLLASAGAILLLGVSVLVARSIAKPLRIMNDATQKVGRGDLDIDLSSIRSSDEVGQLAAALTRMADGLKERDRIRDTFGRYLTREVVNRLLEHQDGLKLGGEEREISMIMSDLRGFTAITGDMPPETVIRFLNRYLGKMLEIIIDHRGIVDEIIGDGILSFFGAPEPLDNHPEFAVACALKMQAAMEDINRLNEADGLPTLEMGVAVNTGRVVVGNIGSEKRTKYGAVGSQVNLTGRIESYTVGGQVLISENTYNRVADLVEIRNVLEVRMKGVDDTMKLYDVRGISGALAVRLKHEDSAMETLRKSIPVRVFPMAEKALTGTSLHGTVTAVGDHGAFINVDRPVQVRTDIKLEVPAGEDRGAAVYAKVVESTDENDYCTIEIHFTSVSAEAKLVFERARIRTE